MQNTGFLKKDAHDWFQSQNEKTGVQVVSERKGTSMQKVSSNIQILAVERSSFEKTLIHVVYSKAHAAHFQHLAPPAPAYS